MGPAPTRFIPYAGRTWAISELARHLGLDPQVMRWRVDHWEPERWAEPAAPKAKLTAAQVDALRQRVRAARGYAERARVVGEVSREHGLRRDWVSKVARGLAWKE